MQLPASQIRWLAAALAATALAVTAAAPASAYPTPDDPPAKRPPAAAQSNVDTQISKRPSRSGKVKKGPKAKAAPARRSTAPGWQGQRPPGQQAQ